MEQKAVAKRIKIEDLVLDKSNPRFAELYSGSDDEKDIIKYLLFEESADEVAEAIYKVKEFYQDRPLWVIKDGEKYIVKDGNRRCSAVKALKNPEDYGIKIDRFEIEELPVLLYNNISDVEARIRQEHTSSLFKQWGRIAKALEIHRLFLTGVSLELMSEIDSSPKDLLKLASFYYEAVKVLGDELRKLFRAGKGKGEGKTIIFERFFRYREHCGYDFNRNLIKIFKQRAVYFIFKKYVTLFE